MGLKQDLWIKKIKSWVPDWFYDADDAKIRNAYIVALAKVLESAEIELENDHAMTFIGTAVAGFLDMMGDEIGVKRLINELDTRYRIRIRYESTKTRADIESIKKMVDELLIAGECSISEDEETALFLNQDVYLNRSYIFTETIINTFSVVVDKQVRAAETFCDRDNFLNLENVIGQVDSELELFETILQTIFDNMAGGTLFRLVERTA